MFGFASKVYLEYWRGPDRTALPLDGHTADKTAGADAAAEDDAELQCLDSCLQKLAVEDRDLVIKYYSKERAEKIELRRQLAEFLGVSQDVLHVRVYRIRQNLRKCVSKCIEKKRC